MSWFKRLKEGIQTATRNKKEAPEGLWYKCDRCKETSTAKELRENFHKCPKCNYHTRIGSDDYFEIIFDAEYQLLHEELKSKDALSFEDVKSYPQRLEEAYKKNSVSDAITVALGNIDDNKLVIACMDFSFIGGSMGSVVGERISRAIDSAIASKCPFFSLMTDPTTGGVTASFAMLGDINMAEPECLIGFAGPRVIKETIKRELPEGFQTAEFLLEKGFLDFIVDRKNLKETMRDLLVLFAKN
jgi:acetyl-CoA carboxylase carboxyl transferase subunit beta